MKLRFPLWLALVFAALWPFAASAQRTAVAPEQAAFEQLAGKARVPGGVRVLVEMRVGAQAAGTAGAAGATQRKRAIEQAQDRALSGIAANTPRQVHRYRNLPFLAMEVDEAALRAAAAHPSVAAVHEDTLSAPGLAQSGPLVGAPGASAASASGSGQHIAIVDTGVDRNHSFLRQVGGASKVVYEACFSTTSSANGGSVSACPNHADTQTGTGAAAPCAVGSCLHGTHVAGIAAGNGANASPVQAFSGIAKDANLIALQVFSIFTHPAVCGSSGTPCALSYTSDQLRALDHLYDIRGSYNVAAANMSLGGSAYTSTCDFHPLKPAIDQLRSAGIATVIASGNNGYVNAVSAPACISTAVSVGATTKQDEVAVYTNSAYMLNLLAPGSLITSSTPGNGYQVLSGTSMATPHVAGAFAALKSKFPAADVTAILNALGNSGQPIFDPGNNLTKPRIRLVEAIAALEAAGTVLAVTPADGLFATGATGGPFTPASRDYVLTNVGTGTLNFTAAVGATWATASPSSGSLAANQSATVTVSIGGNAASQPAGVYGSSVNFVNTVTGNGNTSRPLGLTVTVPVPVNDKFVDAIALGTTVGHVDATNLGASKDPGEPNHAGQPGGKSVWWRWTAPANGQVTFDTFGSIFDTVLAAYTGNAVEALTPVASDNNTGGPQSRITFSVTAGTIYRIAVDGVAGTGGQISLNWGFVEDVFRPDDLVLTPNTGFASIGPHGGTGAGFQPASIAYTLTNTSIGARTFSVTNLPAWLAASPGSGSINPGESAAVTLSIVGTAANQLPAGSYAGTVNFNALARDVSLLVLAGNTINDAFVNRIALTGSALSVTGSSQGASKEPGEPDHAGKAGGASAWWSWTAPASPAAQTVTIHTTNSGFDTLLGVYTGNDVAALTPVASGDDQIGSRQSRVVFEATGGTTYQIAVDGNLGASGPISLHIATTAGGTPANDALVNAAVLTGNSVTATGTNVGATAEFGIGNPPGPEPAHAGQPAQKSVWWKWTPTTQAQIYADTFGSSFDTRLAVYVGNGLTPYASSDDFGGPQSRLSFISIAGVPHYIAVDGKNGAEGTIALRLGTQQPQVAGSNALVMFSQPGDYIGQGQTRTILGGSPNATFFAHRSGFGGISLTIRDGADQWTIDFGALKLAPGTYATLAPGVYENAVRFSLHNGLSAGLSVSGNGRGCNTVAGSFEVLEANFHPNGTDIISFAANFVQICDGQPGALYGQVRIGSNIPVDAEPVLPALFSFAPVDNALRNALVVSAPATISDIGSAPVSISGGEYSIDGGPFTGAPGTIGNGQSIRLRVLTPASSGSVATANLRIGAASAKFRVTTAIGTGDNVLFFRSDAGDYVGAGRERSLFAPTGYTLTLTGNDRNGASVAIAGNASTWQLNLAGPSSATLAPGVYEGATRSGSATQPRLEFSGESRGCNTVSGRFEILEVAYGTDGVPSSLAANFEQHCNGGGPALFGRVRVNSTWPLYSDASKKRDLGGDGKSDILWKYESSGTTYVWRMNGTGIAGTGSPATVGGPGAGWSVQGMGDFNGDGRADVLWRNSVSGAVVVWLMNADGTSIMSSGSPATVADASWVVQGVGDFDGDGYADVLWRNSSTGTVLAWLMNANGLSIRSSASPATVPAEWTVQGIGDFDGDGKSDILWRNAGSGTVLVWLMNGAVIAGTGSPATVADTNWVVQGVGDFNGDGRADVLWKYATNGNTLVWLMNANGTSILGTGSPATVGGAGGWEVKGVGDYNGDGRADVFWKHANGTTLVWLMNAAGTGILSSGSPATVGTDPNWQVQNPK